MIYKKKVTAKNLIRVLLILRSMSGEDMSMEVEQIEERIREIMDHNGLELEMDEGVIDR